MHPPTPHTDPDVGKARILVVDDDEIVLVGLVATLSHEGYDVSTSTNGYAAMDAVAGEDYDLIITDLMMPGLSGLELIDRLHACGTATPIMMLSGYPSKSMADAALDRGASAFLVKPVNTTRLRDTVSSVLDRSAEMAE